jgi:hypothetical protein
MEKEDNSIAKTAETKEESTSETKEVSFPEFVFKSFECLFNQNKTLHEALHTYLEKQFQSTSDKIQHVETTYVDVTKDIMKGLQEANDELISRTYELYEIKKFLEEDTDQKISSMKKNSLLKPFPAIPEENVDDQKIDDNLRVVDYVLDKL